MLVQSERFVEAHRGRTTDISIFDHESNPTTWRLAHMNLVIRGIEDPRLLAVVRERLKGVGDAWFCRADS